MNRIQKYVWLIDTIRRHGRLSFRELSEIYRDDKDMSDDKKLSRATFNRWRDEVLFTFGIEIACDRSDDNRSFINNPDGTPLYENTMQYAILKKEWIAKNS